MLSINPARTRGSTLARRKALVVGALNAAGAVFFIHAVPVVAPLFAQPPDVPSVSASAPSPQWAAAADRARPIVRAAVVEQNLPGVSIAVGIGGGPREIFLGGGLRWGGVG